MGGRDRGLVGGIEDVHAQLVVIDDHGFTVDDAEPGEGVECLTYLFRRRRPLSGRRSGQVVLDDVGSHTIRLAHSTNRLHPWFPHSQLAQTSWPAQLARWRVSSVRERRPSLR